MYWCIACVRLVLGLGRYRRPGHALNPRARAASPPAAPIPQHRLFRDLAFMTERSLTGPRIAPPFPDNYSKTAEPRNSREPLFALEAPLLDHAARAKSPRACKRRTPGRARRRRGAGSCRRARKPGSFSAATMAAPNFAITVAASRPAPARRPNFADDAGKSVLREGRHIRKDIGARFGRRGERLQRAGADLPHHGRHVADHAVEMGGEISVIAGAAPR